MGIEQLQQLPPQAAVSPFIHNVLTEVAISDGPEKALEFIDSVRGNLVDQTDQWNVNIRSDAEVGEYFPMQHEEHAAYLAKLEEIAKLAELSDDIAEHQDIRGAVERYLTPAEQPEERVVAVDPSIRWRKPRSATDSHRIWQKPVSEPVPAAPEAQLSVIMDSRGRAMLTAWESRRSSLLSEKGRREVVTVARDMGKIMLGQTAAREATTARLHGRVADKRQVIEQIRSGRPVDRRIRGARRTTREFNRTQRNVSAVRRLYQTSIG